MVALFVLGLVVVTSLAAYLVGRQRLGLPRAALGGALGRVLEMIGMSTIFLVINVALGLVVILAVRSFAGYFLSVYLLNDASLVALSLLQGLIFESWRSRRRG